MEPSVHVSFFTLVWLYDLPYLHTNSYYCQHGLKISPLTCKERETSLAVGAIPKFRYRLFNQLICRGENIAVCPKGQLWSWLVTILVISVRESTFIYGVRLLALAFGFYHRCIDFLLTIAHMHGDFGPIQIQTPFFPSCSHSFFFNLSTYSTYTCNFPKMTIVRMG